MQYVAFHYRLLCDPIDPDAKTQGCWKAFDTMEFAYDWLIRRSRKSPSSPQGWTILKDSDVPACYRDLTVRDTISFRLALANYLKYCGYELI